MAIQLYDKYPGRAGIKSPSYPGGSFLDSSGGATLDGTPVQKDWANDMLGFMDIIVAKAGVSYSNVPDTALTSDRFTALTKLFNRIISYYETSYTLGIYSAFSYSTAPFSAPVNGDVFSLKINTSYDASGSALLSMNGVIKPLVEGDGSAIVKNRLLANNTYFIRYSSTSGGRWEILSASPRPTSYFSYYESGYTDGAYTITSYSGYNISPVPGDMIIVKFSTTYGTTTAATLSLLGVAKPIVEENGTAITPYRIRANTSYALRYSSTSGGRWEIITHNAITSPDVYFEHQTFYDDGGGKSVKYVYTPLPAPAVRYITDIIYNRVPLFDIDTVNNKFKPAKGKYWFRSEEVFADCFSYISWLHNITTDTKIKYSFKGQNNTYEQRKSQNMPAVVETDLDCNGTDEYQLRNYITSDIAATDYNQGSPGSVQFVYNVNNIYMKTLLTKLDV